MEKVLIIQEIIPHYRIPLFAEIAKDKNIQLSVAYDNVNKYNREAYSQLDIIPYHKKKIGKYTYVKNIKQLIKGYDQIIVIGNLFWLPTFIILFLFKRKSKLFFWGIGISSSSGLHKKTIHDKIRFLLSDLSNGTILYSKKVYEYYVKNVRKKNQIFVAPNTLYVEEFPFPEANRTKILSIGSFKKNKNLGQLIIAFKNIINQIPENITLDFIGDGEENKKLKDLVSEFGLQKRITFWGRMEDNHHIFPIISKSMVSVSPNQAGLSVLHSMAFGCPFLTSENAITGGEIFNIENNITGYLYDGTLKDLESKLLWIINNPELNMKIARKGYDFYHKNRSISQIANVFFRILHG